MSLAMVEQIEPFYDPSQEEDLDKAWDMLHEYDEYGIDTRILTSKAKIMTANEVSVIFYPPLDPMDKEQKKEALESYDLLIDRFKQITGRYFVPHTLDEYHGMFGRIQNVWTNRYFLPRVEKGTIEQYDQFVIARAEHTGLEDVEVRVNDFRCTDIERLYRALSSIVLLPRLGSDSIDLIAPPHVEVTGDIGHGLVYDWNNLDASMEHHTLEIYPSTLKLLNLELGISKYGDILEEKLEEPRHKFADLSQAIAQLTGRESDTSEGSGKEIAMKRALYLSKSVAELANLGDKVKCIVESNDDFGITLILSSCNVLNTKKYGFFIQKEANGGISLWQSPLKKSKSKDLVCNKEDTKLANSKVTDVFVDNILSAANF